MENNIKVVFFDMEGTLFKPTVYRVDGSLSPSVWTMIEDRLGEEVKKKAFDFFQKWNRGGYDSYDQWVNESNRLYQSAGLTETMFRDILAEVKYFPGVHETVKALHDAGCRTALISGGLENHAERAVRELGIHHAFAACRLFFDDQGGLSHWEARNTDYENKVRYRNEVADLYGARPEECAFVGDGENDVHIARSVGTSVAFNGHPELQKVCTHAVNQPKGEEDFRAVLDYLLPYEPR